MDHKLTFLLSGALALTVLLAACGEPQGGVSPSPAVSASDPESTAPVEVEPSSGAPESSDPAQPSAPMYTEPAVEPSAPESPASGELKELAATFIGESVDDLIAAIGEPTGSDYAPSCLGSGEDGELFYDGFSVYTYREGDTETVQDVL